MIITSSTFRPDNHLQADGRRYISETHIADDGREFSFEYLADDSMDPAAICEARRAQLERAE